MIAAILAILIVIAAGVPLALAIDRGARGAELIGLAILYGSGAVMFALMLPMKWNAAYVIGVLIVLGAIAWRAHAVRPYNSHRRGAQCAPSVFDALTAIMIASYAAFVSVAAPPEWDFWTDWGLKARIFLERGGIDWKWLENPLHRLAHPDYPPLVPLNFVFPQLLQGGWSDRWLGLLFVAWAVAVLLIVRTLTASAVATLAAAPIAMSMYVGLAEGALIAFAGAALLFLRRALLEDHPIDWRHGALLLGLAANCKNEGLALIATAAIGVVITDPRRWRRVLRLWPAVVVAAPWLLMRATHALPTDIAEGSMIERLSRRMASASNIFVMLNDLLVDRWLWIAILVTLLIVPRAISRERFIIAVTVLQLALYVAVYFVTPSATDIHIATSWARLPRQMQLPITVVCVMLLAEMVFVARPPASR